MSIKYVFNPTTGNLDATDKVAFNGEVNAGSAASPSIFFTGDTNTGIYSPGADQLALSTNGTGRLFIDASGRAGIGTSVPASTLHVAGTTTAYGNGTASLFWGNTSTLGALTYSGTTAIIQQNTTADGLAFGRGTTEQARIDSSGRLLVGTSSSADLNANVQSIGTTAYRFYGFRYGSDSGILTIGSANGTQASPSALTSPNLNLGIFQFRSYDGAAYRDGAWISATAESQWASGSCPTRLTFSTTASGASSPTERVRIDSAGRVGIGTSAPNYELQVNASDALSGIQLTNTSTGTTASDGFLIYNNGVNATISNEESGYLRFQTAGLERAQIDSSGRLLVGTSSARSNFAGNTATPLVQIEGVTAATASSSVVRGAADVTGPTFNLGKTRGASVGQHTVVASGDQCGVITFQGADGTNLIHAAQIAAEVDGTPGTNNMPGRIVLSTTAAGAASPTERMRITNDGRVLLGATTGDSGLVVDRAVSRAALGTTAPARIYTGAGTITDNTTVASGTVAHGTIVSFDNPAIAATNASVTYTRASTLYVDGAPTAGTNVTISNRYGLFVNAGNTVLGENVTIGGAVIPASATASLTLVNGTIPSASVVNGVSLYAEDVSSSSELKVRDEAGNITTLSPHNFSLIPEGPSEEMAWAFYSERDGTKINVDMLKAIRLLEQLTGEQLVYLSEAQ